MSELPSGWADVHLGELITLNYGKSLPATVRDGGEFPVYGSNGIVGGHSQPLTSSPAIIVGRKGSFGEVHLSNGPSFPIDTTYFIDEFNATELMFTYYLLAHLPLTQMNRSTAIPGLNREDAYALRVSLPPLAEQRRIVAKVGALTARTARARRDVDRVPSLITRYQERLLSLALAGELTSAWREARNLAPGIKVKLGEVAERFDYGSSAKSSKEGSIPVLRMGNIQDGRLDWSDLVYTSEPDEIDKYRLQRGDVLFNRTNSPALVGKTALFDSDREAIHAGYLIRVRCGPSLLPSFLTYCLNSPMGRAYSWQVKTDGVSQSNINAKKLAAFPFWLPSLDEQAEIVRRIDTAFAWLDRVTAEHAAATKLLSKLDASILAKAFRGELVPQHPSDEPASALLARIRAEPRAEAKGRPVRSEGTVLESRGRLRDEVIRAPKRTRGQEVSKSRQDDDVLGKPYLAGKLKKMPSRSVQDLFRVADLGVADFYKQLAWEIAEGHILDNAQALQAA